MNIETVNELIASLESAGELSIREQKFLKLAKAFKQLAAENVAMRCRWCHAHVSVIPNAGPLLAGTKQNYRCDMSRQID